MSTAAMLELSDGSVALIDHEDVARVVPFAWNLPPAGDARYPIGSQCGDNGACQYVYLHRLIANAGPDDIVLHRNRDTLDNRRENLVVLGRMTAPAYLPADDYAIIAAD